MNTAVLFIIFNQPEITQRVFAEIRKAKPPKLFVAADGPRTDKIGEAEECEQTRAIIKQVDWNCKVYRNFRQKNVGCRIAVSSAITWFFENVNEGIILEYDCLPVPSFFSFCEKMLEMYRDDERVMAISGSNFQFGRKRGNASYYFSRIPSAWGWASWKRAWKYWDSDIPSFPYFKQNNEIKILFHNNRVQKFWIGKLEKVHRGIYRNNWGFAWVYAVFSQNGLCVTPNINLVSNIGFSPKATHATDLNHPHANLPTYKIDVDNLIHPSCFLPHLEADEYFSLCLHKVEGEKLSEKLTIASRKLTVRLRKLAKLVISRRCHQLTKLFFRFR